MRLAGSLKIRSQGFHRCVNSGSADVSRKDISVVSAYCSHKLRCAAIHACERKRPPLAVLCVPPGPPSPARSRSARVAGFATPSSCVRAARAAQCSNLAVAVLRCCGVWRAVLTCGWTMIALFLTRPGSPWHNNITSILRRRWLANFDDRLRPISCSTTAHCFTFLLSPRVKHHPIAIPLTSE